MLIFFWVVTGVDNYKLEKQTEPGVAVDLDLPLSEMHTDEFFMLRKNSQCLLNGLMNNV